MVGYSGCNDVDVKFVCDFPLVGSNPVATNEFCNVFSRNLGCLNSFGHTGKLVPEDFKGQRPLDGVCGERRAVVFVRAMHCDDPLCPVCCYNWAKKQVKRAMNRFGVFELVFKGFELAHVVVSVPDYDFDKDLKFLRKQALAFAEGVGVVGGLVVFHPKSSEHRRCVFKPHFHIVGYLKDGRYDGKVVSEVNRYSDYVLKVLPKRKSVVGTLLYQLSHAGVPSGHGHVVAWFGELNYRKSVNADLKVLVKANELNEKRLAKEKRVCPLCGSKLVHVCRVADVQPFSYKLFEESFVLDDVYSWCVVDDKWHDG